MDPGGYCTLPNHTRYPHGCTSLWITEITPGIHTAVLPCGLLKSHPVSIRLYFPVDYWNHTRYPHGCTSLWITEITPGIHTAVLPCGLLKSHSVSTWLYFPVDYWNHTQYPHGCTSQWITEITECTFLWITEITPSIHMAILPYGLLMFYSSLDNRFFSRLPMAKNLYIRAKP